MTTDPIWKMYESLLDESDRGSIVLAASYVGEALTSLLRAKFESMSPGVNTDSDIEFLLLRQPLPPLQSSSVCARLAFVMGLIDQETRDAVVVLMRFRVPFAHKTGIPELPHDQLLKMVDLLETSLQRHVKKAGLDVQARHAKDRDGKIVPEWKGRLVVATSVLCQILWKAESDITD